MLTFKPYFLATFLFGVAVSAQNTIRDVIQNTPELSTLNQYLTSPSNVRLYNLLADPNANLTLFAPINNAFDQLRQLTTGANAPLTELQMTNALDYQVIPDQIIMSRDLNDGFQQYDTVYNTDNTPGLSKGRTANKLAPNETPQDLTNGLIIYGKSGNFAIFRGLGNPARFVRTDISASNGVIHTIDQVLSPPLNIWTTLQLLVLTKFVDTLRIANVYDTFQSYTGVTILVPTNEALAQFLAAHPEMNPDSLRNVLLNHVIPGYYFSQDLMTRPGFKILTKSGSMVQFSNNPQKGLTVGDAVIKTPDILTESAVVHVIDRVLMPGESTTHMQ